MPRSSVDVETREYLAVPEERLDSTRQTSRWQFLLTHKEGDMGAGVARGPGHPIGTFKEVGRAVFFYRDKAKRAVWRQLGLEVTRSR